MELNEYQDLSGQTRLRSADDLYVRLNLAAEAGEFVGKFAKWRRDGYPDDFEHQAAHELGDILWHVAQAAEDLGYTLDEIAGLNLDKLASRKARGTISGAGDAR